MPTYQYSCTECGHFFEAFQSFSEDSLTECPECGGRLRKVYNAVGVVFKGSGFYRTDSRDTAGAAAKNGTSESSSATGSGSDSSAGSAPASGSGSGSGESGSTGSTGSSSSSTKASSSAG